MTKQKESEYNRTRYQKDPERYVEASRIWAEENPDRVRELKRKKEAARRFRKRNAFIEIVDPKAVFERDLGICQICKEPVDPEDYHIDHVTPLVKGGMHSYANSQLAHPRCNLVKGAK
jgi:5-methylcytosine-specific restriction endonuclease McrA